MDIPLLKNTLSTHRNCPRGNCVSNDLAFGDRALKGAMKAADKSGAQFVIVIGDGELETSKVSIKRMSDGQQTESSLSELVGSVSRMSKEK